MNIANAQFWNVPDTAGLQTFGFDELAAALASAGVGFTEQCRLRRVANQTIPTNQQKVVIFTEVQRDTNEFFNPSEPGRITFKTAGVYMIGGSVLWDNDSAGGDFRDLLILGSGLASPSAGALGRDSDLRATGTFPLGSYPQSISTMTIFEADEFMELRVTQNSGGDLDIQDSQNAAIIFWAARVG